MSNADELIMKAVLKVKQGSKKTKVAEQESNEQLLDKQDFSAEKVINAVNQAGSLDEKLKAYTRASGYKEKSDSGEA